jgi:hypothetical protein
MINYRLNADSKLFGPEMIEERWLQENLSSTNKISCFKECDGSTNH